MSVRTRARRAVDAAQRRAGRRRRVRFYRQFIRPGDLVFDIGANIGARTAVFVQLGARVVAVEPQHALAEQLRATFPRNVTVAEAAVGAEEGEADLMLAEANTLATFSSQWVAEVQASGRFAEFNWAATDHVQVTTLDILIATHGLPAFCKIDVEGYELTALQGLSQPLPALAFEYTHELAHEREQTVRLLDQLGMRQFNFSPLETLRLDLPDWMRLDEFIAYLTTLPRDAEFFGDVYART